MKCWKWMGILSIVLWGTGWMVPGNVYADTDGYTLEDLKLHSAGELVDVCTVEVGHEEYVAAVAFCYGFFEGAIRYAEAISDSRHHKQLVCPPPGTTRLQAVEVFVAHMNANPQYVDEGAVDAIYRALIPRWPCAK
jgi:hypothetical protein